jgi:glycosyltransferase involved in cell wall biosynthesis
VPLTIAHVLSSVHIGGAECVALELASLQVKAGFRVLVVSLEEPPNGQLGPEFTRVGATLLTEPKGPGYDVTLTPRLVRLFKRERVDVVHSHNPMPLIYAATGAKIAGCGAVHTKHGPHIDWSRRLWLRRIGAFCADNFVAVSQATADASQELREVSPRKLRVIPNGTDLGRFHPDAEARAAVRAEFGIPQNAWVIGTVGRMAEVKNHPLLVRAAAPLLGEERHLMIVGDGAEGERTRALAASLPAGKWMHFPGHRRDVSRLLTAFDVFTLSSDSEGLPLVLPEAMAVGLPVVTTNVGGISEVVKEGETGFLVPARDEEALRDRLKRLRDDAALAARMSARAREIAVARYSSERMVNEYITLYRRLRG